MQYLYGSKTGATRKLVATFDTEPQLLTYVRWATLQELAAGFRKFEQGSPLAGYSDHEYSSEPLTADDPEAVPHNPSPSML